MTSEGSPVAELERTKLLHPLADCSQAVASSDALKRLLLDEEQYVNYYLSPLISNLSNSTGQTSVAEHRR